MFNEKNIVKVIAVGPLIFIPLIVVVISLFIAKASSDNFQKNIQKLETKLVHAEQKAIKVRVDGVVRHIAYRKSVINQRVMGIVKKRVGNAYRIATRIYEEYKNTKSNKEIKSLIITALRPITWNNEESYIWIVDYDGVLHLGPDYLHNLEKKSVMNLRDTTGKYVIKEEIATCKEKKEGFLWDSFTKPNEDPSRQFKQVAFVKAFGHFNWYFGSAFYLDTAQKNTEANLLESLKKIYELNDNYVLISSMDGEFLLNRDLPELIGKNIHDLNNPMLLVPFNKAKKLLSEKDSGFDRYSWINKTTNQKETKYSYVRKVPNSDWMVASGYLESSLKNLVAKESVELYKSHNIEVKNLLVISIVLIIISLIISYLISRYIKRSYSRYQCQINSNTTELQKLNETLEYRVLHRTEELERLTKELEILATTDSLTNIHNRYSLMNILNIEIHRSVRYKQALSIIMYDIDYFKNINDDFGHDVGDKVLSELTTVVKKSLRDIDFLGRYGGEEFLVIMPATTLENAKEIASRIRKGVEKHNFKTGVKITISLGLVQLEDGEDRDAIFKRLDNLLYDSKHNGRNRLSF